MTEEILSQPKPVEMTARELAAMKLTEADWLVRDLLTRKSVNLLSAGPGFGKTYFVLQLAFCIAEGTPFLEEFSPIKPSKVLVLLLEQSLPEYNPRILAYEWKGGPSDNVVFRQELILASEADWKQFKDDIVSGGYDMVCIDPVSMVGLPSRFDWNDASAVIPFMRKLIGIAQETGVAFLIVHHKKKQPLDAYLDKYSEEFDRTTASGSSFITNLSSTRISIRSLHKTGSMREISVWGKSVVARKFRAKQGERGYWELSQRADLTPVDLGFAKCAVCGFLGDPQTAKDHPAHLANRGIT
jgi:RecA-family ATPase